MNARLCAPLAFAVVLAPAGVAAEGLQIAHDGVSCVVAGQFPKLLARVGPAPAVGRARVHFRAVGTSAWYFVEMTRDADTWTGVLPKPSASLSRFTYYVEATGTSFEEARTLEYSPRVVRERGECEARAFVAAVSATGPTLVGAPFGAPAAPAGFAPLSPAVASAAAGGGVAGSGSSTGLVLGVAGGALAAGGVALLAAGGKDEAAPTAQAPPASGAGSGSTSPGTARAPQSLILSLSANCTLYGGTTIYAGDKVTVGRGMCDWTSRSEAQAACDGQSATITVDGRPLAGVRYSIGYDGGNGLYCSSADADWTAVAGQHLATGIWTLPGSPLHSCTMTVQP